MTRTNKFPAARAVLELVNTVVDEAAAEHITIANTNDPETLALIKRAVEQVEKAQAERAVQHPAGVAGLGRTPPYREEPNSVEALTIYQAEQRRPFGL